MTFSSARSAPLYVRLADQLREGILSGQWHPGDTLPSEPELCALHGVSRGTVVKAIDLLIQDGLVQRKQGSGTFVSKPSLHRQPGFLLSFSEAIRQQERVPTQRLLELTRLSAAQAREYGCTTPMVRLLRLRLVDGVPCAIHDCVLPHNVAQRLPEFSEPDLATLKAEDFSMYAAYARAGLEVDHAEEILRARNATEKEAHLLGIAPNTALMTITRKSFDVRGDLLEIVESDCPGDTYHYHARLQSPGTFHTRLPPRKGLGWKLV